MTTPLDNVNWNSFYQAYTGISFTIKKDNCQIFVPAYKNLFHYTTQTPPITSTEMGFRDEWSSQAFLATGSTDKLNGILLQDLWNYADGVTSNTSAGILWDDFNEKLSFYDTEVTETTLYDFVKDIDTFMVFHKLSKFGNVWWYKRVTSDLEGTNTSYANVFVPNQTDFEGTGAAEIMRFWSPDKYINDEYKRFMHDPNTYTGIFTSSDFVSHGWFTVPDLKISTKPFEKLKIAHILLNLNFVFDPKNNFGSYYTVESTIASRIKDLTSGEVLDNTQIKGNQNDSTYIDTLVNNWVGGLVSTANIQAVGEVGVANTECNKAQNITPNSNEISHVIAAQISINPEYDAFKKELTGTIDSINWKSGENIINTHRIGVLNEDRAYGGGSGTMDDGVIFGGISHIVGQSPTVLDSVEVWSGTAFSSKIESASVPRCMHVQGSIGSSTMAVLAGYSSFNTVDSTQFGEYSKSGVRDDLEMFVNDGTMLSYFRSVPNFKLTYPRGDAAGYLSISSKTDQDKYAAENALKNFRTSQDNEQTINEFIEDKSGTGNSKRYTISNMVGIIYGGSATGNSYLSSRAPVGELLDSFERIQNVFVCVGQTNNDALIPPTTNICQQTVIDVLTIDCKANSGVTIQLPKCGIYRIKYINGGGQKGAVVMNSGNANSGIASTNSRGFFSGLVGQIITANQNLVHGVVNTVDNVASSVKNDVVNVVNDIKGIF